MSSVGRKLPGHSNLTELGKGFVNPSLYPACGVEAKDVTGFHPQKNENSSSFSETARGYLPWIRSLVALVSGGLPRGLLRLRGVDPKAAFVA
jgi:hypothetical protein